MKDMICACGNKAEYSQNLKFNGFDIDGWVCKSCAEVYYNPEKAERILLLNKLQKRKFSLKLSQVRSNLIIRIPKEVGQALNLHNGDLVEFSVKGRNEMIVVAQ